MKPIYFFTICARPDPDSVNFDEFGGAYINAYVDATTEAEALEAAQAEAKKEGWIIESVDESCKDDVDGFNHTDSGPRYYEQALTDGIVLVIHTWPNDAPDGPPKH